MERADERGSGFVGAGTTPRRIGPRATVRPDCCVWWLRRLIRWRPRDLRRSMRASDRRNAKTALECFKHSRPMRHKTDAFPWTLRGGKQARSLVQRNRGVNHGGWATTEMQVTWERFGADFLERAGGCTLNAIIWGSQTKRTPPVCLECFKHSRLGAAVKETLLHGLFRAFALESPGNLAPLGNSSPRYPS